MHTTKDLAERLGVNAQTVRRWAAQYSPYLTGERTGDSFSFTDDDLLLLWSVRRWRQLGYSLDDIGQRLTAGERISEPPPVAQTTEEQPRALMIPEGQFTAALAEIKRLEGERERLLTERDRAIEQREDLNLQLRELEGKLGELRGKLSNIESERRTSSFWLAVLAAAVIITAILVVLLTRLG